MKYFRRGVCLALSFLLLLSFTVSAYAGDPNIDGGGGGMGDGSEQNSWSPGNDGVRVTVIEEATKNAVTTPIDYTNISPSSETLNFGKRHKLIYSAGSPLSPQSGGGYTFTHPAKPLPRIISTSAGNSNIAAVKEYFATDGTAEDISIATGFSYDKLISGKYVLLLEPIAYFKFNGMDYAMTATEAALYDFLYAGGLARVMGLLTHQNLPFSMFLEKDDLGFPAWGGLTFGMQNNDSIIQALGLGTVRFTEPPPESEEFDIEYRVDTDVITSFTVTALNDTHPDNPASVDLYAGDIRAGNFAVTIPQGETQYVWIKWRTPKKPGTVDITAAPHGSISLNASKIHAKIVDLNEYAPPDPKGRDRNDRFKLPKIKEFVPDKTSAQWEVYEAWLDTRVVEYRNIPSGWFIIEIYYIWVHHPGDPDDPDDDGWDERVPERAKVGKWKYNRHDFSATLTASQAAIKPDEKVPTAKGKQMKSAYGFNAEVKTRLTSNAASGDIAGPQTVTALFPEFSYDSYCRLLEREGSGVNAVFKFQKNMFSMYQNRVHFTPIWFPDGPYTVPLLVFDAWTPAGMLSLQKKDQLTIEGNVYDDWYIRKY